MALCRVQVIAFITVVLLPGVCAASSSPKPAQEIAYVGVQTVRGSSTDTWYIRLTAQSGTLLDDANVFGQATTSIDGYDQFDLPELDPFGDDFLTIVFPHLDWGQQAGNYASDYHSFKNPPTNETWTFEIYSSNPSAQVTLTWAQQLGPVDKLSPSLLFDNETGAIIEPQAGGSYELTMTGTSRSLKWVVRGPCDESLDLAQGQWKLISIPCDPGTANTVAEVFGDDLVVGDYDVNWVMYRRDEDLTAYVKLNTNDPLEVGEGYWIKSNQAQQVNMQGLNLLFADIPLTGVAGDLTGCANSDGQCNMVGHPYNFDVCWGDVLIVDGASTLTPDAADPNGVCQGGSPGACVMSGIAHKWTGGGYAPMNALTPGLEGTLVAWDGVFVSANKPGIKLRIPATTSNCGPPARGAAGGLSAGEWYVRLIATSGELEDRANVFGRLADSVAGYDAHDLKEIEPFGTPYLTIVFPHPKWGKFAADYSSDYRNVNPRRRTESWNFEVRGWDPGMPVTLRWEGDDSVLINATLLDVDNSVTVSLDKGAYKFNTVAESHRFRWVQR